MDILLQLLLVLSVILFIASVILFIRLSPKNNFKKRTAQKTDELKEASDFSMGTLDFEAAPKNKILMKWWGFIAKIKNLNSGHRYRKEINLSDFDYRSDNILEKDM
ncbi:hypothetical protein [Spongiimicrobium salis]|uniref:hypothetical protein n=1 Tax=Spongiimicrobium salis TaxID=1667022 RepID=UPI00374D617A